MEFILENISTRVSADRAEINEGFFCGNTAIIKPTVYILDFYSLDSEVKVEVSIPEDHIYAGEMEKLKKGKGERFTLNMV